MSFLPVRSLNSDKIRFLCFGPKTLKKSFGPGFVCHVSALIADGTNQRATTLPIPRVVTTQGIYPSLPDSRLQVYIAMQVQHS